MKHHILQSLQHLEDQWGLDMPERLEDGIKFLIREFTFLDFFLSLQSFIDLSYMLDVVENVQLLFHHVTVELREISEIGQVVRLTDQLRVEIKMTKLEIRSEYLFPKVNKDGIVFVNPKFVINFIDTVVVNLGDLLKVNCSSSLLFVRGGKKEIGEVFKELKLLRNFVCFVSDRFVEMKREHIDLFIHVLEVVSHAAMIAWLYLPSNDDEGTNGLLSDHLEMKIKPIDPSIRKIYIDVLQALRSEWRPIIPIDHVADCVAGFVETLQHNLKTLSVSNSNTHQIIALQEMLNLLIANLSVRDLEFHLQDIDTVMVDCGILVYSLCEDVVLGDVTIDFPVTIHRIKRLIYYIIRKEFQSNLPRIHGLGYIDFVLSNLIEFQVRYPDSLDFVKAQLQLIQRKLEIAVQLYNIHNKLQEIGKAAYEVEYIVDSCVSKRVPDWCLKLWLWDINAEVAEIQQNIMSEIDSSSSSVLYIISSSVSRSPSSISISPRRKLLASPSTIAINTSPKSSELAKTSRINEDIIGFEDDIKTLIHQLTRRTRRLDIISIVGMPGGGKTTLAKKIYIHPLVVSRFDIQAECYVSPIYSLRGLLLSLLAKLHIDETSLHSIETVQLEFILGKTLRSKRYLILLDDIWDGKVWDDLKRYFPNSNNGSRILLTTRNHDVAYYVKSVSEPHHLRLLTYEESWELLKLKVCGNESCSPLVEKVGQEIARKCGGLPLSIVLVAGILSKKEKTEECWSQVAKDLSSYIASDAKAIIEPSYEHLPYYLKPCFLYFGIFLEDEEINVSKLTWLWIGEGFIKDLEGGSLQYIAKGYLENLIERNLVMNAKRSSGKVKTCRVHNLLLDFCKRKAEEEHFLLRIKWDQNDKSLSGVSSHKQLAQRRLAFYCEEENLVKWSSSCCPVDSVLFREYKRVDISSSRQASQFFYNFKFLKVLNLESIVICSFPTGLVYLRYFAAQTDQDSITSLIANLWNLETLILKPTKGRLKLPVTIWKMVRLRHLCIDNAYFTLDGAEGLLKKLEVLSNPCFSCAKDVELLSQKTPNLRELRCSFVDFRQEFFPKLDFLAWLETLEIHLAADSTVGGPYNFPPSLRNLTLSNFFLGSCHKSNISRLPHLRVLKLVSIFFDNDQWEVKGGEFLQLEVLKLVKCDFFEEWKASDEAFSMLNHLVLRECPYLKEIPSSFQDIFTLDLIKVKSCSESVEQSATVIKHMKAHCGNYLLKVFIQRENRNSLPENGELLLEQRGDEGDEKDQLLYSMDGLKEVVDEEEEKEEVKLIKGIINPAQGNQIDLDDDLFPEFEDFLSGEIECPLPSDKYDIGREEREKVYQIEMANNANELERLRNRVRILQERERNLEVELLEYYGLKEQESHIIELQKQLKIKSFEIHILSIKMNTLQAENQKLQEEVFHGTTARKDLEAARSKITELQKQMQLEANQTKAQLLLKQHVTGLQEKEEEAFKRDSKVDKKLKLVKELEVEVMELKRKNKELQHEKRALVIKLDAAESKIESLSNMTENEMVAQVREEVTNLKHTNEDLLKQVEGPQMNRFSEVEELVHLRWVNACLRHELRNYQTPQGKVSARDLSKNLSPRSEQKAKQLMLEYAGSERGQGDTDLESNFSQPSSPGSEDFDNASIDSSTSRFSTFSKKPNLIQKLKKWGSRGGKDNSSIMSSPARSLGGASPGRMSMSVRPRGLLELLMRNAGDGVAITRFGTAEEYDSPETPKLPPIRTQESSAEALNSVASSFSLMSKSVEGVLDEKYPAFKDRHKLAVEREKTIKVKAEQARAARFEKSLPPRLAQLKEKPVSLPGSVPVLPVVSASGDSAEPSGDGKTDSQAVSKMKLVNIEKRPTRTSRPPPKRSGGGPAPAGNNVTGGAPGGPPPPPPPPPGGGPPRPPPPPPPPPPGGGPPRPPPPPGSLMKGGAGGDKVHRAPELVEFYQSLMKRESKKDTSSALITATSNTSDARSNMIREIENRSTFLLAVKADVESRGEFVESLATEVHAASFTNIEDLVAFVNWLDEELSFLVDERAVLKHFDWPEGKADAFREAAFEYQDLMKLEKQVTTFVDDPNLQCDAALKKMYRLLKKVEQSVYALLGTRDMAASRYREFGIPTDWLQDSGVVGKIKLSSVQLARKYMKCVATELDAMDGPEKEPNREFFILQGFAGGFDAESMKAFEELRSRVQSQTGGENTQES